MVIGPEPDDPDFLVSSFSTDTILIMYVNVPPVRRG